MNVWLNEIKKLDLVKIKNPKEHPTLFFVYCWMTKKAEKYNKMTG